MELYPAIDIRGGRCVRLRQGDYADETVYGDDPVEVARGFAEAGAVWIHAVDLDAARTGSGANRSVVAAIAKDVRALNVRVQTGGGVRSERDIEELLALGVARVIVGTRAVQDPDFIASVAPRFTVRSVSASMPGRWPMGPMRSLRTVGRRAPAWTCSPCWHDLTT